MTTHEESKQAFRNAIRELESAYQSGKWLALIVNIKDGRIHVNQTTWEFPKDDFGKVLELHRELIEQELGLRRPEPLPRRTNGEDDVEQIERPVGFVGTPPPRFASGSNGESNLQRDQIGEPTDAGAAESDRRVEDLN